tara:strand:- start:2039 stop:2305 length:267 start_codon:yes stop_codon:yes gene_type:complete
MTESPTSYKKHRPQRRARQADYYEENKNTIAVSTARYRKENRDEINRKKREAHAKSREGKVDKRFKGNGGIIPTNRGKYDRSKKGLTK